MIAVAAGLLYLLCSAATFPIQLERLGNDAVIAGSLIGNDSAAVETCALSLQKRSPAGKGKGSAGSSSRSRHSSYYEVPAEQDMPSRAVIRSDDFLGFIDRAIISGNKASRADNMYSQEGPLKWLSRAKASLLRDENIMRETENRYAAKMANPGLTAEGFSRTAEKKATWEQLCLLPRDEAVEAMVYNVAESYRSDVGRLREEYAMLKEEGAPRSELEPIRNKQKEAQAAFDLWNNDVSLQDVHKMINKELTMYARSAEAAKRSRDPSHRADMIDHATKAIAWYTRV